MGSLVGAIDDSSIPAIIEPEEDASGKAISSPPTPQLTANSKKSKAPNKKKLKRKKFEPKVFPIPVKVPKRRPGWLFMLGWNLWGQLGFQDEIVKSPTMVPTLENKKIKSVACGEAHTLVLDTDGIVWSFGFNGEKALGRPTETRLDEVTPAPVRIPSKVKQISAGVCHSAALTIEGQVYAWGCYMNRDGKRYGVDSYLPEEEDAEYCAKPWPITAELKDEHCLEDLRIIKILSGDHHIVMMGDNFRFYTCGAWDSGQLGREQSAVPLRRTRCLDKTQSGYWLTDREYYLKPSLARIGNKYDVRNVWAGKNCSYIFAGKTGQIYVCGDNSCSQLGVEVNENDEDTVFIKRPIKSNAFNCGELENVRWRQIVGGLHHTIALTETGQVYTIGSAANGRLSNSGVNIDGNVGKGPKLVGDLENRICIQVGAGCNEQLYALTMDGDLYAWGGEPTFREGNLSPESPCSGTPRLFRGVDKEVHELQKIAVGGQHIALIMSSKLSNS